MKLSTSAHRTSPAQPARIARRFWVKSVMPRRVSRSPRRATRFAFSLFRHFITSLLLVACSSSADKNPKALTLLIESNPANLDPRFATDGQSQHLDGLLFSSLVQRDDQMVLHGDL